MAGEESEIKLSTEFDSLAKSEGRAADFFRGLTILLFVIVIVYSAMVALSTREPSLELVQKAVVGIPVLLLAGYFGREAGHHRKTARWSSVLGVQLRSVRAYTADLDEDETRSLRTEFGRRVFMETPDSVDAQSGDGNSVQVDAGLMRELTELVRVAQRASGSKP